LPDGTEASLADCKDAFLKRLRKPLSYLGAETGDLVVFEFDLHSRAMKMRIGDKSSSSWQKAEISIT
jgi:hypothetical protein